MERRFTIVEFPARGLDDLGNGFRVTDVESLYGLMIEPACDGLLCAEPGPGGWAGMRMFVDALSRAEVPFCACWDNDGGGMLRAGYSPGDGRYRIAGSDQIREAESPDASLLGELHALLSQGRHVRARRILDLEMARPDRVMYSLAFERVGPPSSPPGKVIAFPFS